MKLLAICLHSKKQLQALIMDSVVSNDESVLIVESDDSTMFNFNDSTTQDAFDFEEDSNDDSYQNTSDPDEVKVNRTPVLTVRMPKFFMDSNNVSILSPISELAVNVAKTKLNSTNSALTLGK